MMFMEVGQRVKVTEALDTGKEGEIVDKHTKIVTPAALQVGGDDKPVEYCTVKLDDGHINLYPLDWIEAISS
jgi:hypothetical protein